MFVCLYVYVIRLSGLIPKTNITTHYDTINKTTDVSINAIESKKKKKKCCTQKSRDGSSFLILLCVYVFMKRPFLCSLHITEPLKCDSHHRLCSIQLFLHYNYYYLLGFSRSAPPNGLISNTHTNTTVQLCSPFDVAIEWGAHLNNAVARLYR